jgi:hypothetical protein
MKIVYTNGRKWSRNSSETEDGLNRSLEVQDTRKLAIK